MRRPVLADKHVSVLSAKWPCTRFFSPCLLHCEQASFSWTDPLKILKIYTLYKSRCIWGCKIINIKIFTMGSNTLSHQISVQLQWWIHPIHKLQHNNIVPRLCTWPNPLTDSLKTFYQNIWQDNGLCTLEESSHLFCWCERRATPPGEISLLSTRCLVWRQKRKSTGN